MFSEPDFDSIDPRDFDAADSLGPQPLPPMGQSAPESVDLTASFMSEIYAAAWTMARRDHELDRLFNAEFYQGGEI